MPSNIALAAGALALALAAARVPAQTSAGLDAGIRHFESDEYAQAKEVLGAVAERERENAAAAYYLGRAHFEDGDFGQASRWLRRAVERAPDSSAYHQWLGRAYGEQARRANVLRRPSLASKVRSELERAVVLDPGNLDARRDLLEFYLRAPSLLGGSREKAKREARELAARSDYHGHMAEARLREAEGDAAAATHEYEAAILAAPDSAAAYLALGFLQQSASDHEGAFRTFARAAERFPGEISALYQVGRTAALSGLHLEEGARALQEYLRRTPGRRDPSLASAHWRLAQVYRRLGRVADARAELTEALRLDRNLDEARAELSSLP